MKSPLILLAYRLNQSIQTFLFPAYFIYWDEKVEKWKLFNKNEKLKLIPYLIGSFGIVGVIGIGAGIFMAFALYHSPNILPFEEVVLFTFFYLATPISVLCDMAIFLFGEDLIALTNWYIKFDWNGSNKKIRISSSTIEQELRKIWRGEEHWLGLLLTIAVITLFIDATFLPFGVLYFNLDPFYFVLKVVSRLLGLEKNMALGTGIFVRYVLINYTLQAMFLNARAIILTSFQIAFSTLTHISKMESKGNQFNEDVLLENRMLSVAIATNTRFFEFILGGVIAIGFIFLGVGCNVFLFGIKGWSNVFIPAMALLFTVSMVGGLHLTFDVGSSVNKKSLKIKENWKKCLMGCGRGKKKLFMKLIRSFRPHAIPVGVVGTLNGNSKMDFMDATLNYIFNVFVGAQEA
ncbi:unnamed protein product [Orchesella dallaii]|uniref:Odorant receptor n=1 Tax=Orchesella dallaii TaxID=48710 RepID=A0ABP1S1E9_9HEXA